MVAAAAVIGAGVSGAGIAAADNPPAPAPAPAAAPPAPAPAELMLTTIPGGDGHSDITPTLQVRADGHAVKAADASGKNQPVNGTIPGDVLAGVLSDVKALVPADMGVPRNADKSSTLLDYVGATPDQDMHLVVYAPNASDGLTDAEKTNRKRFTELCTELLGAFVPDR
jgi:hypothetical protein